MSTTTQSNVCRTCLNPQKLFYSHSCIPGVLTEDTKICRCSCPLHKLVQNKVLSQLSLFTVSQSWMENIIFNLSFIASVVANLDLQRADCMFIEKNSHISGPCKFKWSCSRVNYTSVISGTKYGHD